MVQGIKFGQEWQKIAEYNRRIGERLQRIAVMFSELEFAAATHCSFESSNTQFTEQQFPSNNNPFVFAPGVPVDRPTGLLQFAMRLPPAV